MVTQHVTVLEISQLDLEVWCLETLPDAPSILGNLAGISVQLVSDVLGCSEALIVL